MTSRLWIALFLTACGVGSGDVEDCKNKLDDDGNGLIDCADPVCASAECIEICDDGFDNNLDDAIDCDDPQCDGEGCGEICTDGRDNDANGEIDCADSGCAAECDKDDDGFLDVAGGGDDCNDLDPAINPAAAELCDEIDNDCNGLVDRDDPNIDPIAVTLWYLDGDGDGFGTPVNALYACDQPSGRVDNHDDCDDEDPTANPTTPEICNGLDDNCDGLIDDQDPTVDLSNATTWYVDNDGDGLGASGYSQDACNRPNGYADNNGDCDDADNSILGPSLWVQDLDGDGYGGGVPIGPFGCNPPGAQYLPDYTPWDCDDAASGTHPGAYEFCGDYQDTDCDGNDCAVWSEDFEGGSLGGDWTSGGNAQWFVQAGTVYEGAYAAECGNINDLENSWMATTVNFLLPGTVEFWHTGSTEINYDFLEFRMDGTLLLSRSGTWGWTFATYPVAVGSHSFEWRYRKDITLSGGSDTVWVDSISMPGGQP